MAGGENLYGYTENDPVNNIDPHGNVSVVAVAAGVVVVLLAVNAWNQFFKKSEALQQETRKLDYNGGDLTEWAKRYSENYGARNQAFLEAAEAAGEACKATPGTSMTGPLPLNDIDIILSGAAAAASAGGDGKGNDDD